MDPYDLAPLPIRLALEREPVVAMKPHGERVSRPTHPFEREATVPFVFV